MNDGDDHNDDDEVVCEREGKEREREDEEEGRRVGEVESVDVSGCGTGCGIGGQIVVGPGFVFSGCRNQGPAVFDPCLVARTQPSLDEYGLAPGTENTLKFIRTNGSFRNEMRDRGAE